MNTIKKKPNTSRTSGRYKMDNAVSAKESDWVQACIDAAEDDNFYRIFRSSKPFQRVIEGTPIAGGIWNLKRLLKDTKFIKALPSIQASDTLGLPINMIDFAVTSTNTKPSSTIYSLSPTTIRYANNVLNCISLFGNNILNGKVEFYEIGAGYGGECKIFNDLAVTIFNSRIGKKWHVYDLPSSKGIIERFLSNFHYSASFDKLNSCIPQRGSNNFVISNAAFSEMRGKLLDEYFDSVIANSKYGYFITNFETHSVPYGGWTTEEFIKRLRACGKTDVTILPTVEYLSYFDHQAGSKLIVFGHKGMKRRQVNIKDVAQILLISKMTTILNFMKGNFMKKYNSNHENN